MFVSLGVSIGLTREQDIYETVATQPQGKIILHLLFGWSLDKDKKKFGSIQTILMKVWIDPN